MPKRPRLKGRNKKRPIEKNPETETKFCPQKLAEKECFFGDRCRFMHNVDEYMAKKPPDLGDTCYVYDTYGYCPYSFACRFASKHIDADGKNMKNEELYERMKDKKGILNILDKDVQKKLWKKKYDFSLADSVWKSVKKVQEEIEAVVKLRRDKNQLCVNKSLDVTEAGGNSIKQTSDVQGSACCDQLDVNIDTTSEIHSKDSQSPNKGDCQIGSAAGSHDICVEEDHNNSLKLCTNMFKDLNRSKEKKKVCSNVLLHDQIWLINFHVPDCNFFFLFWVHQ